MRKTFEGGMHTPHLKWNRPGCLKTQGHLQIKFDERKLNCFLGSRAVPCHAELPQNVTAANLPR